MGGADRVAAAKKAWVTRRANAGGVAAPPIRGTSGRGTGSASLSRKLSHELTALDRKEGQREIKRMGRENIYRLGHYLEAGSRVASEVRKGRSASDAFASAFNPTRGMHGVAKRLGLGLTVERGQWRRKS